METVYKVIEDCVVKKLGERKYEFTASTSAMDRDGEVIDVKGWDLKNFKKNPVIMYAHDYKTLPIGRSSRVWVSNDGTLKNTVEFPPEGTYEFADIVERLVDTGYLRTESVGFIPKEWDDGDGERSPRRTYTKQELLEISIVPVPSNPEALMNAVDDGVITTKQFKAIVGEEKSINFNEELHRSQLNDAFYGMIDTLVKCYHKTVGDKQDDDKVKTIKSHANSFHANFVKWIVDAGEAGLFNQSDSGFDALFFSYNDYLSKVSKQKPKVVQKEEKEPKEVSQEEIKDEIDYLKLMVDEVGLNDDVKEYAKELITALGGNERISGSDIPVEDTDDLDYQEILEAIKRIANKTEGI